MSDIAVGKGKLILVPTPIDESSPLGSVAHQQLLMAVDNPATNLVLVEDLRPGRRRWIRWGLPRAALADLLAYNEHTSMELNAQLLLKLDRGVNIFLLSDGGLPAFCDPGQQLVDLCHRHHITVTATPFDNSVLLALALSGFEHRCFYFAGFLPRKENERQMAIRALAQRPETLIVLDTPYRLAALLNDLASVPAFNKRQMLVALNLGHRASGEGLGEQLIRDYLPKLCQKNLGKAEFVLVVAPNSCVPADNLL